MKSRLHILLVENDLQDLDAAVKLLSKIHCELNIWTGLMVPEILLQREPLPDLVIINLHSSVHGCFHFVEALRRSERTKNTPVLILTNSVIEKHILDSFELGAHACRSKPLTFQKLVEDLQKLGFDTNLILRSE